MATDSVVPLIKPDGSAITTYPDLSTLEARKALAGKYAAKYLIDTALICAVCEQESSWIPWAIRFEPAFEAKYIKPACPASPTTNELTRAMSFGLMQIMGETAVEFGFTGPYLTELCNPDVGVDYGCRKLRRCLDKLFSDVGAALEAYNGGAKKNYASQVQMRMSRYF